LFLANPSSSPLVSDTLEMQLVEYYSFLSGMARHGTTSKSKLPNLVKVVVMVELSEDASKLVELQRMIMPGTVVILIEQSTEC
jgi:hypothetical protein